MKHEFLNGDAMKELIVDNSVDLFVMWPPYLGVDIVRYGNIQQLNKINDRIIFSQKIAKIAKNCEKALKDSGNLILIFPSNDPSLLHYMTKYINKKTKLMYNGVLIWDYSSKKNVDPNTLNSHFCHVVWYSKGNPKVNMEFLSKNNYGIMSYELTPDYLVEKYGQMGHVYDALPEPIAEHLIQLFSDPGDTVANVLGGTGTVSIAAENTGRDSVYNDISYVQLTIAKKRMEDLVASKKKKDIKKKLKSAEEDEDEE